MSRAIRNVAKLKTGNTGDLTIIIPSAGEGTRMKTYGPKSLINIKPNITILDYQVKLLKEFFPTSTIILVNGYESVKVMNNAPQNIIHIENERYNTTNVVRSIGIGLRASITNRVMIIYGDLICNKETFNIVLDNESLLFVDKSNTMTENEVGCMIVDDIVEHLIYDLPQKWAQIIYITGKELKIFKDIAYNPANENWLGFEAINAVIDKGGKFKVASPKNMKANDIDISKDILIAQGII